MDNTVLVAPSSDFVASLPGGKVPDREDFTNLSEPERVARWYDVVDRCRMLAAELQALIETGRLPDRLQPFEA